MNLGLLTSLAIHTTLILWALVTIQRVKPIEIPPPPAIAVSMVSPSELAALAKGERNAKNLTSEGAEGTAKKDPPKQVKTPPPPPRDAAPPPPPPPPAAEATPEPIKEAALKEPPPPVPPPPPKAAEPPPPPPGPSAEEKKKLEDAILADQAKAAEEAQKAAAAKAAAAEAERKRLEEAEKKRQADLEKKRLADLEKKRLAELEKKRQADLTRKKAAEAEARAKAEAEAKAKEFNPDDIMKKIETAGDPGPKQALIDKRPPKPAQVAGSKGAGPKGPQSGDPTGTAPLTTGEANQLVAIMRDQLARCWNINSGHPDAARMQPVFDFELNKDGSLRGEPALRNPDSSPAFQDAANAARRALRCASPFKGLPPEKYEHWESASFRFDPSQMFR